MSWSKTFVGHIDDIKEQVATEVDPSANYLEGNAKKFHGNLFEVAKSSLLKLIELEEQEDESTKHISAVFYGSGFPGNMEFNVKVVRINGTGNTKVSSNVEVKEVSNNETK